MKFKSGDKVVFKKDPVVIYTFVGPAADGKSVIIDNSDFGSIKTEEKYLILESKVFKNSKNEYLLIEENCTLVSYTSGFDVSNYDPCLDGDFRVVIIKTE